MTELFDIISIGLMIGIPATCTNMYGYISKSKELDNIKKNNPTSWREEVQGDLEKTLDFCKKNTEQYLFTYPGHKLASYFALKE